MIKTAIASLLGCLLCLHLPAVPDMQWFWLCLPILIVTAWWRQATLFFFILGLIWAGYQARQTLDQQLPAPIEGRDMLVEGMIASIPEQQDRKIGFIFESENPLLPARIRLNWYSPVSDIPAAGEHWQLMVRLKAPHGLSNPGGFDYEGWLFRQNIGATGYVRGSDDNRRLTEACGCNIDHWRQQLRDRLNSLAPDTASLPLIVGLSIGIRDKLAPQHWDTLRKTGTSHLLAISGLHIGLAAALGFFLLRWLWSCSTRALLMLTAQQAGAIGGILFALFYALLAGLSIPTQRALIMVTTVLLGLVLKRPHYTGHILALSLFLVLLHDPFAVLSAGFWLSYAAVTLILLTCNGRIPSPRWQWAGIHLWIAVGLTPLLILFFQQTSLVAPLANLVAVPLVSLLVVPLLLLTTVLLWIAEPVAMWTLKAASFLLDILWQWLQLLADLPLADWQFNLFPAYLIALMMICMLLVLSPRGMPARWLGVFAFIPLLLFQPQRPESDQFWFTLLDVGQGLSAVVETTNHVLVFDSGPRFSGSFDAGSAVIVPFLRHQGVQRIDKLVISHADNDHIGGLDALLEQVSISQIMTSAPDKITSSLPCKAGQRWQWDGVEFLFLHPTTAAATENNASCVLKVSSRDYSILLTGDIERDSENQLIAHYQDALKADVLVVPHHGSNTSSTTTFIKAVAPDYALFSTGYRNRYHFPSRQVLSRYRNLGIELLRTDYEGAILFRPSPDNTLIPDRWRHKYENLWTWKATE